MNKCREEGHASRILAHVRESCHLTHHQTHPRREEYWKLLHEHYIDSEDLCVYKYYVTTQRHSTEALTCLMSMWSGAMSAQMSAWSCWTQGGMLAAETIFRWCQLNRKFDYWCRCNGVVFVLPRAFWTSRVFCAQVSQQASAHIWCTRTNPDDVVVQNTSFNVIHVWWVNCSWRKRNTKIIGWW